MTNMEGVTAPTPRTDAWVRLWNLILLASLALSLYVATGAVQSDLCDDRGECWGAVILWTMWSGGQLILAAPSAIGIAVLVRYALRGNRGWPLVGLGAFLVNVAVCVALFAYLSITS